MALSLLGGLYAAAFHPAALAANPPAPTTQVSATVNPTSYYYEPTKRTFRVPPSASISPIKDVAIPTVQKLPNGALAQQISSGIEITALKGGQLRGPIYGRITAGVSSLRSAAAGCFKSGRCNVGLMVGALGLQSLLDSVDWVMDEGGRPQKINSGENNLSPMPSGYSGWNPPPPYDSTPYATAQGSCAAQGRLIGGPVAEVRYNDPTYVSCIIGGIYGGSIPITYKSPAQCPPDFERINNICVPPSSYSSVSDAQIDDALSAYSPDPTDWRYLVPEIDLGAPDVNAEITDAPRLQAPPVTTTIYDANGVPVEVQETNTWVDFVPKDNPSKQPSVDAVETEKTDTFNKNGEPTGSKTETKPQAAPPAGAIVIPPAPPPDLPTDCAFMPTVCEWLDWFKKDEPLEEPNFDDAKQVIDLRDYKENVTIGPTTQQCPEPMEFTVPYVNATVAVSWQPFCDLADLVRPLLLLLAYFGGAVLTIRSI